MTTTEPTVEALPARTPIRGEQRTGLLPRIADAYRGGDSVRAIANRYGRSYGWTHRMLADAGVKFRPRGGAHS